MADYLEIRNENNSVIVGDDYPILQPIESRITDFTEFTGSYFTNTGSVQGYGPRQSQKPLDTPDSIVGWGLPGSPFKVMHPREIGNSARATAEIKLMNMTINPSVSPAMATFLYAFNDNPVRVHEVVLSYKRGNNAPVSGSALAAYNSNNELVFDSALGTAHLLKSIRVKPGLGNGDKLIEVGDFNGFELDFRRVFYRVERSLYKSLTQYSNGGLGYRVGWYAWTPSIYMDENDKMWVKLKYYTPHGYGTYESHPISDTFNIQIFYLPSIRLY